MGQAGTAVSIHLMLLFIQVLLAFQCGTMHVSIHLMLLFILGAFAVSRSFSSSFNTSHVAIYHLQNTPIVFWKYCFNTSHVAIYLHYSGRDRDRLDKFQYISCCYLSNLSSTGIQPSFVSIHLMLLFIRRDP